MGTTADKLNKLLETKQAIKQAIIDKGVSVGDDTKFADYPSKINSITTGGGDSAYQNPDFYEILTNDGTNYYSLFRYKTINNTSFIESLNTSKVTTMEFTFSSFTSSSLDLSNWDVSKVTNMRNIFNYANVTSLNLTGWSTDKVTDMYYMFSDCKATIITGLEDWDISNVKSMEYMFHKCKATSLDISNWDVSNVTNMSSMFTEITLEVLDISDWDTSKVTNFGGVYWFIGGNSYDTKTQNLTTVIGELDLSSCTSGMYYSTSYFCFNYLPKLETLYLKNIYKNVTMKNETKWSINLNRTKVKDECLIYIINELPDLINDKGLTATNNIVLTLPPTNTLTQEQVQVAINKGWQVINTTY